MLNSVPERPLQMKDNKNNDIKNNRRWQFQPFMMHYITLLYCLINDDDKWRIHFQNVPSVFRRKQMYEGALRFIVRAGRLTNV